MAKTSEVIAGIALGIPIMSWVLVPIITFLMNKFFSILLNDDTSRKLSNLENLTIPSLKETLIEVEEQRMLRAAKDARSESDLRTLDGLATELKSALYEAEEILDLIDYYRIEKKIVDEAKEHGRSWVQQILRAFGSCMVHCKGSSWVQHLHDGVDFWSFASPAASGACSEDQMGNFHFPVHPPFLWCRGSAAGIGITCSISPAAFDLGCSGSVTGSGTSYSKPPAADMGCRYSVVSSGVSY